MKNPYSFEYVRNVNVLQLCEAVRKMNTQAEYINYIYSAVVPGFEYLAELNGYVYCSQADWKRICAACMEVDNRINRRLQNEAPWKEILAGGAWMNYGFSTARPTVPAGTFVVPGKINAKLLTPQQEFALAKKLDAVDIEQFRSFGNDDYGVINLRAYLNELVRISEAETKAPLTLWLPSLATSMGWKLFSRRFETLSRYVGSLPTMIRGTIHCRDTAPESALVMS